MKQFSQTALLGLFFILSVSACATRQSPVEVTSTGVWETSAQITDLRNQKKQYASIEFVAQRPDRLRLEATGPIGLKLATVVMNGDQLDYLLHLKKQAFETTTSGAGLKDGLGVPVDPRLLLNLLFDEPVRSKNWTCTLGADAKVSQCQRLEDGLVIAWSERDGNRKRMSVKTQTHELQIVAKSFESKMLGSETFRLEVPDSYTKHKKR